MKSYDILLVLKLLIFLLKLMIFEQKLLSDSSKSCGATNIQNKKHKKKYNKDHVCLGKYFIILDHLRLLWQSKFFHIYEFIHDIAFLIQ